MKTCEKCGGTLYEYGDPITIEAGAPSAYGHKPGCPDGIVCDHKNLRRSCEICERDARIVELEEDYRAKACERDQWVERAKELERQLAEARSNYDEEVAEFNAGYAAAEKGEPDDEPCGLKHDVWRVGYAWAMHDTLLAQLAAEREELDLFRNLFREARMPDTTVAIGQVCPHCGWYLWPDPVTGKFTRCGCEPAKPAPHDEDLVGYGYAPGNYCVRCYVCGHDFTGDKNAGTCRPCAERIWFSRKLDTWTLSANPAETKEERCPECGALRIVPEYRTCGACGHDFGAAEKPAELEHDHA